MNLQVVEADKLEISLSIKEKIIILKITDAYTMSGCDDATVTENVEGFYAGCLNIQNLNEHLLMKMHCLN